MKHTVLLYFLSTIVVSAPAFADELENITFADQLQKMGNFSSAQIYYLKALKTSPENPSYNYKLAMCYQSQNQYDLAIDYMKIASRLSEHNPEYTKILNHLLSIKVSPLLESAYKESVGENEAKEVNLNAAIKNYRKALSIYDNDEIRKKLISLLILANKHDEAEIEKLKIRKKEKNGILDTPANFSSSNSVDLSKVHD